MSARPGQIKAVIPIDLPRPRSLTMLQNPRFNALEQDVRTWMQEAPSPGLTRSVAAEQ